MARGTSAPLVATLAFDPVPGIVWSWRPLDAQAPTGSLRDPLEESKGIDVLRVDLKVTDPEGR